MLRQWFKKNKRKVLSFHVLLQHSFNKSRIVHWVLGVALKMLPWPEDRVCTIRLHSCYLPLFSKILLCENVYWLPEGTIYSFVALRSSSDSLNLVSFVQTENVAIVSVLHSANSVKTSSSAFGQVLRSIGGILKLVYSFAKSPTTATAGPNDQSMWAHFVLWCVIAKCLSFL